MCAGSHWLRVALVCSADLAGPWLEPLRQHGDSPEGQPYPNGADRQDEVEAVPRLAPPEDPRQMAPAAKHGAAFVILPGECVGRFLGVIGIGAGTSFADGVLIHAPILRKTARRAKSAADYRKTSAQSATAMPEMAIMMGVIHTPPSKTGC